MNTKPKARRFRIRRAAPLTMGLPDAGEVQAAPDRAASVAAFLKSGMTRTGPAANAPTGGGGQDRAPQAAAAPLQHDRAISLPEAASSSDRTAAAGPDPAGMAPQRSFSAQETDLEAIKREGLTGRQLRLARRVAQKHAIAVASDFDAVRQLRLRGIDPFQRSHILDLVRPAAEAAFSSAGEGRGEPGPSASGLQGEGQSSEGQSGEGQGRAGQIGRIQLPQTRPEPAGLPSTERARATESHVSEVMAIQRDILRRRRRKVAMLFARLAVFVLLPTFMAGWYFFVIATPMYATKSEFIIQQADSAAGAGLGGLFQGTSMATQQDSITVQSYLSSRAAFRRLDESHGFKAHFADTSIDPIQRLPADASNEAAFRMYQNRVRLSYDPTEGIIRMEVIAADPETSQQFSEALIAYAEEQVDQLTQRLREDQMAGARASYEAAERRRAEALSELLRIQSEVQQIDPIGETAARTAQISALETSRQQLTLDLQQRLSVPRPNEAQVASIRSQIENIESLIADLRSEMTQATEQGASLAARNTELRLAEENYTFQTILVQQALQMMEAAQIEANRQVRFLSLGVEPVAPDEATYPRAFENTLLAFLIFAGIYLMVSLTVSILREQVTS